MTQSDQSVQRPGGSRRGFLAKVGAVGLGATAAVFASGKAANAAPGVAATYHVACCNLAYASRAPWNHFLTDCGCTGSNWYAWSCCQNGTRYGCGECYCEGYSAYGATGSC